MWTRAELKERAKNALKCNYWILVLGGFILAFLSGNIGSSSSYRTSYSDLQKSLRNYDVDSLTSAGVSVIGNGWSGQGAKALKPYIQRLADSPELSLVIGGVIVMALVITVIGLAISIFLFNPLIAGGHRFFNRSLVMNTRIGEFGYAFKGSYMNVVKIMFLKQLYTFLWSLLFVIPGIVKSYEYYLVPYIIGDDPDIDASEAFRISKELMMGNKFNAWVLDLSFIGWYILTGMTCGLLGIFYVTPYVYLTKAALYRKLRGLDYAQYDQSGYNGGNQWNNQQYQNNDGNQWSNQQYQNNGGNQWNNQSYQNNGGDQWNNQQYQNNGGDQWNNQPAQYGQDYYSGGSQWDSETNSYREDDKEDK